MLNRRHFVTSAMALTATSAIAPYAFAALDPTNPDIKFGTTGSIFGAWSGADGATAFCTGAVCTGRCLGFCCRRQG